MKKGPSKWIAFDFDTTATVKANNGTITIKQPKDVEIKKSMKKGSTQDEYLNKSNSNQRRMNFNLLEKVRPRYVEDLAIHVKKIKEVEIWLEQNVCSSGNKPFAPLLLLTGPTGSGKTATLSVLCKKLGITVAEWITPVDQNIEMTFNNAQITMFLEFFALSKYTSLYDDINNKKLALVEDFPNFVTHNPTEFTGILEKCHVGRSPVVFICTNATNSKLDLSQSLFPQDVREKFHITTINFNPCSATLLKTALKRAQNFTKVHPDLFRSVTSDVIDAIVSSTMGDIRCAINQYNFACLKDTVNLPGVKNLEKNRGTKRKRSEDSTSLIKSMIKDESLGFFHGLGRVLNPKRTVIKDSWRLQYDFDSLIDQFATQPSVFSSFLQENYLKYFGDLNDVQKAADILSQSQVFLVNWSSRNDVVNYALWISVFGLMVYNEHRISKWNQIKAPTKINNAIDNNLETRYLSKDDYSYYNVITNTNKFFTFKC